MSEVWVCTKCLICFDGHIGKCPHCGRATTKVSKVTKNTVTFKIEDEGEAEK